MRLHQVLFDFDNTLFDTETVKEYFWKIASVHGFTSEETLQLYKKARQAGGHITITMESFLSVLKQALNEVKKPFLDRPVYELIKQMESAGGLLPGAKKLLELCQRVPMERYLLSLGVKEWQEQKVKRSGVDRYFEPSHIVFTAVAEDGKEQVVKRLFGQTFTGAGSALFNDKPDETAGLLKAFPKLIAFVRHEVRDGRYSTTDFDDLAKQFPNRVVYAEQLDDLIPIFKSIL